MPLIEDLLDAAIAWSITASALIGLDEEQAASAPVEEEPPPPQPTPRRNGRRQLAEDLL